VIGGKWNPLGQHRSLNQKSFIRLNRSECRSLYESGRFAAGVHWIFSGMALASESRNPRPQALRSEHASDAGAYASKNPTPRRREATFLSFNAKVATQDPDEPQKGTSRISD
jgi:hypothetical protein